MQRTKPETTPNLDQGNDSPSITIGDAIERADWSGLATDMMAMMSQLFPVCRSITGDGNRKTLEALQARIPLQVHEVPTGYQAFDWTVPQEWNIRDAYIKDSQGKKIVDFQKSNLHVLNYSTPVSATMTLEELKPHLYANPAHPDAVPYVTSYYEQRWGFCLSQDQLDQLPAGNYEVYIDSSIEDGSLTFADAVLPGESEREILLSTYFCHPSMANDNLSGPVLLAFLHQFLAQCRLNYTYRFVYVPETLGALVYLSQHGDHLTKNLHAGYVASCVGDPGPYTYKRSRQGGTLADKVAEHCLSYLENDGEDDGKAEIVDFFPMGSDERQYCSPGFNLPVGSLMRSMYGTYPEYHTSLDNLDYVSGDAIASTLRAYLRLVQVHEVNHRYINLSPYGEPQLSKRDLFPTIGATIGGVTDDALTAGRTSRIMYLLSYSDGNNDLVDIAEKAGVPAWQFIPEINALTEAGLLGKST